MKAPSVRHSIYIFQASQPTETERGKSKQPVINPPHLMPSPTVVPDADVSEAQVRTSSDSGLPDEKCASLKSSSVSSSSSNLSTGSPTQTMTHIDPRVALTHILETVGDAALLDDVEKVTSGDVRRVQKEGSLRRHSDENVSPRLQTLQTLSMETKSAETICVKNDESHTAASQAAKDRSKSHQPRPLDELLISVSHVQSTEGSVNRRGNKTELNTGANMVAQRDINIKSSSCAPNVINATKSADCDNVKPSAAVGPQKTNTAAKAAVTRTASVERSKQSNSNVPVKTQGLVAGRPQPLLVKTKQVLSKASQPERNRPRLRQTTRPQPSGTKPQVAAKTNVQRITSSQQATRVKAQQRLSDAIRPTAKKDTPMVPPRVKRRSVTSMSPAIQQLQRTPQKKFTSPTREPQLMRTNKPEQFPGGKIPEESVELAEVRKDPGTVRKSSSMKEVASPVVEQKQLSSSAGSVLLTTKLLLDTSRQNLSGEKHLRVIHHGEHHSVLDTAVETPSVVKPTIHTRPATAIDAPKVTQYTKIFVDNAPDTQKRPPNDSVEHTGPVIQDAFESLNRRKAEEARTLLEKQRQQLLKPKSAMKSRPGSSVKKQGAKSAVYESRPTSVKKSAKAKPTDDTLSKGKKGKAGKKGKSKKKGAATKEKSDECGDNLTGDEWCDNADDKRTTVVQSRLSLSSDGDSDDEYLFSKTSYPGGDLNAGVRSWHRTDVDQTLPGQTQLADPDDELSLLPEHDSIVNSVDLYDDVETILDEVAFGVDDDDTLLTDRTNQTSDSLRLQALIQSQNEEETESENPLRQTDQAIRDFAGTVTNTELDKMLETARNEKDDTLPERTRTRTGVTKSDDKDASSKPGAEAEKPEEEDVNKIIEEILKSTPDPMKSISLKFKERKHRKGSGRRSKTMEDIARELQRSQERTFRELPTQLSHASNDASSDHTLTGSNQKDSNSDPEKTSSSGELEEEQMKKLMDTVKRLQLRVDTNAEAPSSHTKRDDSATKRPPPGPKVSRPVSAIKLPLDGAQYGGGRKPEKSPRFVRRHESFFEVKEAAGSRRQSVSKVRWCPIQNCIYTSECYHYSYVFLGQCSCITQNISFALSKRLQVC